MKKLLIFLLLSFSYQNLNAQLKHYVTIGKVLYADFFNKEKDKFETFFSLPVSLSYKIERERWGAEFWFADYTSFYKPFDQSLPGDEYLITQDVFCIDIQYAALRHKMVSINPFAGLMYRAYHATIFDGWRQQNQYHEPYPAEKYENENQIGIQAGVNINIPVYKGVYANTNLRYNSIPWAKYNKQNLYWEVGLGYKIQRKKNL